MISYALNIVLITIIIYWIYRKYESTQLIKYFVPALAIKLLAGAGVGLLYFYYYGFGDTIGYHQDAIKLSNLFIDNSSKYFEVLFGRATDVSGYLFSNQPRAFFLVKILSIVHLLTKQNYWISGIYFSLYSFIGFWILANTLVKHFPTYKLEIVISLLFFPSVVFWSAGIIKESITMGAIMLLTKLLIDGLFTRKLSSIRIILSGFLLIIVWCLKYYYLGIFLIVSIPLVLIETIPNIKNIKLNVYVIYGLFFLLVTGLISLTHPNFQMSNIVQVIVENHDLYIANSCADQIIHYDNLKSTLMSVSYYFPLAVWSGLFRMGIWEANQWLEYLVAVENLFLLVFTISAVVQIAKLKNIPHKLLAIVALLYVVLLSGFLALSAPNLGTLARYKVGYLPIFLLLITFNNPLLSLLKSKFAAKVEDINE